MIIWAASDPSKLNATTLDALADPDTEVFVSVVSLWEMSIKQALGRLEFPVDDFDAFAEAMGFEVLPILTPHAAKAGRLPMHHKDPFDRMLVAQAAVEDMTLVSDDRHIARYAVAVLAAAG